MEFQQEPNFIEGLKTSNHRNTEASKFRKKTALRVKYEAESQVIINKLGHLEDIREKLGLSQRKMCQLLLVDPSTWSRWQKEPEKVPPHVYRSLQWYLALIEKAPEWHPLNAYLGAFRSNEKRSFSVDKIEREVQDLESQMKTTLHHNQLFLQEVQKQSQIHWGWKLMLVLNLVLLVLSWVF